MDEMVNVINGIQNGDRIVVSVPLIEGSPLVVNGTAEVDASGNVTIRANSTTIPGIPVVGEVNVSNIVLTINRGDAITGSTFDASLSADAYASLGFVSKSISINDAKLTVDLANNTLTVSNAPTINYVVGSIDLNDTYDISGGDTAFSVVNATAMGEATETIGATFTDAQTSMKSLGTLMTPTDLLPYDGDAGSINGNGFTGFNPGQAQTDINNFVTQASAAGAYLCSAYTDLLDQLQDNWCSQNAKVFGDAVTEAASSNFDEYKACISNVYSSAVNAYNKMASVNGVATIGTDANETINTLGASMDFFKGMKLKEVSNQGVVGMNINNVKQLKDNFMAVSKEGETRLENLRASLALFDNDNAQQEAFKNTVNQLAAKFSELDSMVAKAIDTQMNEEINNTQTAASEAAGTFKA